VSVLGHVFKQRLLGIPTSTGFNIHSYLPDNTEGPLENGANGIVPTPLAIGIRVYDDASNLIETRARANPRLRHAPTPTGFAEIVSDDFPVLHAVMDSFPSPFAMRNTLFFLRVSCRPQGFS
jgi:hypothetical protein